MSGKVPLAADLEVVCFNMRTNAIFVQPWTIFPLLPDFGAPADFLATFWTIFPLLPDFGAPAQFLSSLGQFFELCHPASLRLPDEVVPLGGRVFSIQWKSP
ncbi:MAG: hypothetical protein QM270_04935 [Bacillota bacterium]|nr:hypothetical protein [Bacillota bacterium]